MDAMGPTGQKTKALFGLFRQFRIFGKMRRPTLTTVSAAIR